MSLVDADGRIVPETQTEADLMAFISESCGLCDRCVHVVKARKEVK